MVGFWVDFISSGNPNILQGQWSPVDKEHRYLNISGLHSFMGNSENLHERMALWDDIMSNKTSLETTTQTSTMNPTTAPPTATPTNVPTTSSTDTPITTNPGTSTDVSTDDTTQGSTLHLLLPQQRTQGLIKTLGSMVIFDENQGVSDLSKYEFLCPIHVKIIKFLVI